ncbi:MAG TPA: M48 family metalloprotease [Longimicrobiales bacterium]
MRSFEQMRRILPVLALAAGACAVNPATGERQLSLVSEAEEIRMGREYDQQIVAEMGLYPDAELQAYVQELGARLAAKSERPDLPWTFRVVDDPVVNAFALPGGFIYITRGILAHLGSEAELAAVIGHEIGHVTARHSVNQMSRAMLAQVGLGAASVFVPQVADYSQVASAALGLLFLKYGRDDERQSDDLGLRYMRAAGYDPREMPGVFAMLGRVSAAAGGGRTPEWLSTHPDPENRFERISAQVAALPQDFRGTVVGRDDYVRRLDGLVFGDDPRQGFFRDGEFLHPELRFRMRFPDGWKTANQRQAVLAASPAQDAVMQLTLVEAASPQAAARAFAAKDGIRSSAPEPRRINGLPAATLTFTTATQDGQMLQGAAAFIEHDGRIYQVLGYAARGRWADYAAELRRAAGSFRPLDDPELLDVEPMRIRVVRLERAMTVEEFARRYPGPVTVEQLALINGVEPGARLEAGRLVKRVTGEAPAS